jgi:hypothetical protein
MPLGVDGITYRRIAAGDNIDDSGGSIVSYETPMHSTSKIPTLPTHPKIRPQQPPVNIGPFVWWLTVAAEDAVQTALVDRPTAAGCVAETGATVGAYWLRQLLCLVNDLVIVWYLHDNAARASERRSYFFWRG